MIFDLNGMGLVIGGGPVPFFVELGMEASTGTARDGSIVYGGTVSAGAGTPWAEMHGEIVFSGVHSACYFECETFVFYDEAMTKEAIALIISLYDTLTVDQKEYFLFCYSNLCGSQPRRIRACCLSQNKRVIGLTRLLLDFASVNETVSHPLIAAFD